MGTPITYLVYLANVFKGPNGLRAGWRLAIYYILIVLSGLLATIATRKLGLPRRDSSIGDHPWALILSEFFACLIVLVPALVMSRLERRPMRAYGMPLSGSGKLFCEGALWGFLGLTSILLLMRAAGVFYFGVPNPNSGQVLTFGVLWGIAFFLVGVFEEFGFRGYAQFTLSTGLNFWLATALTTLLFLAGHVSNPGETPLGLLDVVLSGVVLCVALLRTGNLWFPIGLHAAWDWAESFFYGVPDSGLLTKGHLFEGKAHGSGWLSGGSAGPEGSIFSVVIEIAFIILLLWRFKENRFPDAKYVVRQQNALL